MAAKNAGKKKQPKQSHKAVTYQRPVPASAPAPSPPAAPTLVDPFFTADDLMALSQFTSDINARLQQIDFDFANLQADTAYQRTQVDKQAKEQSVGSDEQMAARGIFHSSLRDTALYDIEATRSLASKFLNDKLTTAQLQAGTQKTMLGQAKESFDRAQMQKALENARGINDQQNAAYAEAYATWQAQAAKTQANLNANQARPAPTPVQPRGIGTAKKPTTGANTAQGVGTAKRKTAQQKWGKGFGRVGGQR